MLFQLKKKFKKKSRRLTDSYSRGAPLGIMNIHAPFNDSGAVFGNNPQVELQNKKIKYKNKEISHI